MIKIDIYNSESRITGLAPSEHKELADLMSYTIDPQAAYFSNSWRNKRTLLSKRGEFPTGLTYIAAEYVIGTDIEVIDHRTLPEACPGLFDLSFPYAPYPEQKAAAEAAKRFKRGIIVAPTGLGKSAIAALIIQRLQVPTLIVVPNLELKRQLTEDLRNAFGRDKVGTYPERKPIAVENVDALICKEIVTTYDCVIIDEFHHSAAKTYRDLNKKAWKNIYYRLGLTATPFRSNDNERLLLESILADVIYRVEYKDAVAKGYIVPVEAYYVDIPKQAVKGNSWREVYNELVVHNEHLNSIVARVMTSLSPSPTLCLVKEVQQGIRVALELTPGVAFVEGQSVFNRQNILEFNLGERTTLIGTTGILGEGVDSKPAEYIIIAGLGKSRNSLMQQIGRGVRRHGNKKSCKVILFRNNSHKWTKAHYAAQVKTLKEEYGVVPRPISELLPLTDR